MSRIHSIDAIRGLCLINIFVNHITLGMVNRLSPSLIMIFDTSEIFVFLAGISSALIYAKSRTPSFRDNLNKIWARSATIYLANIAIIFLSFCILYVSAALDPPALLADSPQDIMRTRGVATYVWHLATFQQSVGYSMVLRLYVFLTVVTPLYLWCAARRYWLPLLPACAIWLLAGHFSLVRTNSLTGDPFALTILPWNLVYAAGICLGTALVRKVALPRFRTLDILAIALLLGGMLGPTVARFLPELHDWYTNRNEFFWTGASKTLQSPLRVLSLFALVWVFLRFPAAPLLRLLHQARPDSFVCRLGRRSLQVFSFGAVYSVLLDQTLRVLIDKDVIVRHSWTAGLIELAGIAAGLGIMGWIARRPRTAPLLPSTAFGQVVPA